MLTRSRRASPFSFRLSSFGATCGRRNRTTLRTTGMDHANEKLGSPPYRAQNPRLAWFLALSIVAGCGASTPSTETTNTAHGDRDAGATELDAGTPFPIETVTVEECHGAAPVCTAAGSAACTLACLRVAERCLAVAEFIPLGPLGLSTLDVAHVDPRSRYAYYSHVTGSADPHHELFRWSECDGVERLDGELVLAPDHLENAGARFLQMSSQAEVLLYSTVTETGTLGTFRWKPGAAPDHLPQQYSNLSPDGTRAVGWRSPSELVVWDEQAGQTDMGFPAVQDSIGRPEYVGDSGVIVVHYRQDGANRVLWRSTDGAWAEVGSVSPQRDQLTWEPDDAEWLELEALTQHTKVTHSTPAGDVLAGVSGRSDTYQRAFRWTEQHGLRELPPLENLPTDALHREPRISPDGQVVVAIVEPHARTATPFDARIGRWEGDETAEELIEARPSHDLGLVHVSERGDRVLAYEFYAGSITRAFRWTASGGVEEIPSAFDGLVARDGNLIVSTSDSKPLFLSYSEQADPGDLSVFTLEAFTPDGWSPGSARRAAEDGRLVVGLAEAPSGDLEAWMLRRVDLCDGE